MSPLERMWSNDCNDAPLRAAPSEGASSVRVVVIGDVAHVIVERPLALAQLAISDSTKQYSHLVALIFGRRGAVCAPHDHRYLANLAVGNPTQFVFEVARGDDRRFAKIAAVVHFTLTMTVESFFTLVPAAGTVETPVVHCDVPAPGPRVEK